MVFSGKRFIFNNRFTKYLHSTNTEQASARIFRFEQALFLSQFRTLKCTKAAEFLNLNIKQFILLSKYCTSTIVFQATPLLAISNVLHFFKYSSNRYQRFLTIYTTIIWRHIYTCDVLKLMLCTNIIKINYFQLITTEIINYTSLMLAQT